MKNMLKYYLQIIVVIAGVAVVLSSCGKSKQQQEKLIPITTYVDSVNYAVGYFLSLDIITFNDNYIKQDFETGTLKETSILDSTTIKETLKRSCITAFKQGVQGFDFSLNDDNDAIKHAYEIGMSLHQNGILSVISVIDSIPLKETLVVSGFEDGLKGSDRVFSEDKNCYAYLGQQVTKTWAYIMNSVAKEYTFEDDYGEESVWRKTINNGTGRDLSNLRSCTITYGKNAYGTPENILFNNIYTDWQAVSSDDELLGFWRYYKYAMNEDSECMFYEYSGGAQVNVVHIKISNCHFEEASYSSYNYSENTDYSNGAGQLEQIYINGRTYLLVGYAGAHTFNNFGQECGYLPSVRVVTPNGTVFYAYDGMSSLRRLYSNPYGGDYEYFFIDGNGITWLIDDDDIN